MSTVGPFAAQIVRPDKAQRTVRAMTDSQDDSGVDLYQVAVAPGTYDEAPPALYVYRQSRGSTHYTGIVGEIDVAALTDQRVRGHEAVHQLRVDALVWHHARTHSPPALVKLLHQAGPEFEQAVTTAQESEPVLDFDGPDGLRQTLWRLPAGAPTDRLIAALDASVLYIADGHHRCAAAAEEWRASDEPDAPARLPLLAVIYPHDELDLSAFHRRVSGPLNPEHLLDLLDGAFQVRAVTDPPPPAPGSLGLYLAQRWYDVRLIAPRPAGAAGLDVAILQTQVLDRIDPAPPGRVRTVDTYPETTPLDELIGRCDVDGGALFTVAPPPPESVIEVADAGEVMPPKTTYFEPKPAAGIFRFA